MSDGGEKIAGPFTSVTFAPRHAPSSSILTAGGKRGTQRLELGLLEGVAAVQPKKKVVIARLAVLAGQIPERDAVADELIEAGLRAQLA